MNAKPSQPQDVIDRACASLPSLIQSLANKGFAFDEAEDLAQEAVLRLLEYSTELRSPEGWLHRVALNRGWDLRKRRRPALGFVPGSDADPLDASPDALTELCAEEQRQALRTAAERLPVELTCVFCFWWQGWTPAQIADDTGLQLGTVRRRLARARECLRRALAECG